MYFAYYNSFSNNTRLLVIRWVANTINVFFKFKCFSLNSSDSIFRSKWLKFFLSALREKIESFWP